MARSASTPAQAISRLNRLLRQERDLHQELALKVADWQRLAQRIPLGFLQVDENNLVLYCNIAAQRLLHIEGWQPGIKVLLEWVRSYELDQLIQQTRGQDPGLDNMREWYFYPSGGEAKPVPVRAWAVSLSGQQVGIFLEDRLEASTLTAQRDRWASDVAHELKTPLTSIRLVAETLQPRVDPALRTWVDRLLNETIRLSSLVQDLLELSSLNLGSAAVLQISQFDLVALVHEVWNSLEPQVHLDHQTLEYNGPERILLWGDRPRLYRLFLNLLDNSLKYGRPPIHVHLRQEGSRVWGEVFDHGPGLLPEMFQSIFEPFFRADAARARSDGGTGLGLAIVRQVVEAHGGSISAANHNETGGLWIRFGLNTNSLI